ncbi:hypothetical protein ANCCAN_24136 [Ancylostoma caninum]|uniref:Peptidase M13 N-terminal domain-containing protein n=1 Tax=Ancylostoma caninum TaxID=29170 RepID=A0A368FD45_ANCCA|nr:hypothetical protein ANCCAN_24136 [Ancylostoma caninum]
MKWKFRVFLKKTHKFHHWPLIVGLSGVVAALFVTSLVFNILIWTEVNKEQEKPTPAPPPPVPQSSSVEAAAYIISGLDETVDPCDDFYAFTCNKYIKEHNPHDLGVGKFSPSKELQDDVNAEIAEALHKVDVNDAKWSKTERITKALLHSCVYHSTSKTPIDNTIDLLYEIKRLFGGIPFLGHPLKDGFDLFTAMGDLEQTHALGTLMGAMVSVDYKKVSQHALYISQPSLPMPREFYVLPQFTQKLKDREKLLGDVLYKFADTILDDPEEYAKEIKKAALDIVQLERRIAMASWPRTQMRNYAQQYNAYKLADLKKTYPRIKWDSYINALMSTAGKPDFNTAPRVSFWV